MKKLFISICVLLTLSVKAAIFPNYYSTNSNPGDTLYLTNILTGAGGTNNIDVLQAVVNNYAFSSPPGSIVRLVLPPTGASYIWFTNKYGLLIPANAANISGYNGPSFILEGAGWSSTRIRFPNLTNGFAIGCTNGNGAGGLQGFRMRNFSIYGNYFAGVSGGVVNFSTVNSNRANGLQFGWTNGAAVSVFDMTLDHVGVFGFYNGAAITNGVRCNFDSCYLQFNFNDQLIIAKDDNCRLQDLFVAGHAGLSTNAIGIHIVDSGDLVGLGVTVDGGQYSNLKTAVKDETPQRLEVRGGDWETFYGTNGVLDKTVGPLTIGSMNINWTPASWQCVIRLGNAAASQFSGQNSGGGNRFFALDGGDVSWPDYTIINGGNSGSGAGRNVQCVINGTTLCYLPDLKLALNGSTGTGLKIGARSQTTDNNDTSVKYGQIQGTTAYEKYTWTWPLLAYYSYQGGENLIYIGGDGGLPGATGGTSSTNGATGIMFSFNQPVNGSTTSVPGWSMGRGAVFAGGGSAFYPLTPQDLGLPGFGANGVRSLYVTNIVIAGGGSITGGNGILSVTTNSSAVTSIGNPVTLGTAITTGLARTRYTVQFILNDSAVSGTPSLVYSNFTASESWTNANSFALASGSTMTWTSPDVSPSDVVGFYDKSSGSASVTLINSKAKK